MDHYANSPLTVGQDRPRTPRFQISRPDPASYERAMNLNANELRVLLQPGDAILPGDEVYDDDFERWEQAPVGLFNKAVTSQDIVVRRIFDLRPLVRAFVVQVDKLREPGARPDPNWWQAMDAYVAEMKRRIGLKSFDSYDRETGLCAPTVSEGEKPMVGGAMASEVQDFKRRKKIRPS